MNQEELIDILTNNINLNYIEDTNSRLRKKINFKATLKKSLKSDIKNNQALLLESIHKILINCEKTINISDTIINSMPVKQLTNAQIKKLIKEHNDFVKIKIPKGANKKILLKIKVDKGYKVDHANNKFVLKTLHTLILPI